MPSCPRQIAQRVVALAQLVVQTGVLVVNRCGTLQAHNSLPKIGSVGGLCLVPQLLPTLQILRTQAALMLRFERRTISQIADRVDQQQRYSGLSRQVDHPFQIETEVRDHVAVPLVIAMVLNQPPR